MMVGKLYFSAGGSESVIGSSSRQIGKTAKTETENRSIICNQEEMDVIEYTDNTDISLSRMVHV
jgi:hypothetical protein